MKARAFATYLLVTLLTLTPVAHAQDVGAVATAATPSVAVILTKGPNGYSSGTGFMVGGNLVVTAYRVIERAEQILLKFPNHPPVEARVVNADPQSDVAVLSIPPLPVKPLPLGDIAQVQEGQTIVVIGFPRVHALGTQTSSITWGSVSAIRPGRLQIQVAIGPGSSGAPVLNLQGEIVGVVRSTRRGEQQGINFAVPIDAAKPLLGSAVVPPAPSRSVPTPPSAQTTPAPPTPAPAQTTPAPPTPAPAQTTPAPPTPPPAQPTPAPPTPAPAQPERPSAPASSTPVPVVVPIPVVVDPFLISPGKSIGPVTLGLPVQNSFAALGPSKGTTKYQDGSTQYRWFEPPQNSGIGIAATQNDVILRAWALNDPRFRTKEGLHAGSTEAQVRAILGEPTRVVVNDQERVKTLSYDSLGLWFVIQLNPRFAFYNQVFNIGIFETK